MHTHVVLTCYFHLGTRTTILTITKKFLISVKLWVETPNFHPLWACCPEGSWTSLNKLMSISKHVLDINCCWFSFRKAAWVSASYKLLVKFKLLPDQPLSKVCPPAVFLEGVLRTRKMVRSPLEELVPQSSAPPLAPSHLESFCAWPLALLLQRFLPPALSLWGQTVLGLPRHTTGIWGNTGLLPLEGWTLWSLQNPDRLLSDCSFIFGSESLLRLFLVIFYFIRSSHSGEHLSKILFLHASLECEPTSSKRGKTNSSSLFPLLHHALCYNSAQWAGLNTHLPLKINLVSA